VISLEPPRILRARHPRSSPTISAIAKGPMAKPNSYMTRSICSGAAPSRIIKFACRVYPPNIRLPMNPGQLPAMTLTLPMRLPMAMAVARVSGEDASPRTTSSKRITLAGLKKCIPQTDSGREVLAAIASTSSPDVLVARSAPGFIMPSKVSNICFLRSRFS